MKSKTTSIWFLFAAALLAFIWFQHKYLQPAPKPVLTLVPGLHADDITGFQISPAGKREIDVVHTNGSWLLEKPLVYPAQATAIQSLADALSKLIPAARLSAKEISSHANADKEYGFDNPQYSLVVEAGNRTCQLIIGSRTPPGDQVFVRVVGMDGAYVVDSSWLNLLPESPDTWRDTSLVDDIGSCNWIVITNGAKSMEFRRDSTNQLWRMVYPLSARADSSRISSALQQLLDGQVAQFVTDDSRADLSSYGLQPTDLDVWLGRNTNFLAAVHVGKSTPTNSAEVYVQREGWNSVMTANKDIFTPWRATLYDFRDPHLLSPGSPVAEIQVVGEHSFTLQKNGSNDWVMAGEKFPIGTGNVQAFLQLLNGLRISSFVKDVVTSSDLESFGLAKPSRQITLLGKVGDTNDVVAKLMFGSSDTNSHQIYVKRADEDFIYALKTEDVNKLPAYGWEFRDQQIWNFSETNIVSVTLRQSGKMRQLTRTGTDKWSITAGQGVINPPAIEETMHRMGQLAAYYWVGRNIVDPVKNYGLNPDNLAITVELKNGEKLSVNFGAELTKAHTALAAVTLDGERWAFIFPPTLYQFVTTYLTIPPNQP